MAKLSTEIGRELFLYGPAGGKRVTSVKELVRLSGASERAIHAHMPNWKRESEQLASSGTESGLVLCLSSSALAAHKADVDSMRSEADRLKLHLQGLAPSDESYSAISRSFLIMQKQWAAMSGVLAALDAAACAMKETAKLAAKTEAAKALNDTPTHEPEPSARFVFKRRI